ncbi:unnamed protein product [marine sediment metagenome]|uniref:Uncharacterized protein n=1 Tax=marine sediment metagenome TaxID=412755 RepID=X1N4Q2_9ZZZZ
MTKKKQIKVRLGAPRKIGNPYLKSNGSFDLIEKFPSYKNKKKRKKEGE